MLLILETITWKPHIETAMEIALRRRDEGVEVLYCNLRRGLPVCEDRSAWHALLHLPETRIARAGQLLRREGIEFRRPPYSEAERAHAAAEATRMISTCESIDDVRALSYRDFHDIGWSAISSVVTAAKNSRLEIDRSRALLRDYCQAAIMVYEKTISLLEDTQASEVLVFNGRFATTRAALRAAQAMGVPWRIHERGGDKSRFRLSDHLPHDLDRVQEQIRAEWRPGHAEAGHEFFRARRARMEQGWHSFTKGQEHGRLPAQMQEGDWVSFFTSSEDEMASIGDALTNRRFPTQGAAIATLAAAVAQVPGLRLCVRVHPHLALKSSQEKRSWREFQLPGVLVLGPADPTDTYALIERSHVVATYGSSVGIEATYWGRPSLLFARSYYDRLGVATQAESLEQVQSFLREPVTLPQSATLACGAYFSRLGEPFRYYASEGLHRGSILGVYLDDSLPVRAARAVRDGLLALRPGRGPR
jgi:hypothetical protein